MSVFIACLVMGVWHIYNFIGYIWPQIGLPYFRLAGDNHQLLRVFNMLCLNWSVIIGVFLIIFGVVGLLVKDKEENNFSSFKYLILVVAIVVSIGLML